MDAADFRESVEEAKSVELDRLGSSKLLIALTGADLDAERVLSAAADSEHTAMITFQGWADDEDHAAAREAFADAADRERDHYDRVVAELDDGHDPADGGPMHSYLRGLEPTAARLGGAVGRGLVSARSHLQVVSFFVNEGDERRADFFRELRSETEASTERALSILEDVCGDEGERAGDEADRERARAAAEYAIQLAYDDYADALGELGVDPKPIC